MPNNNFRAFTCPSEALSNAYREIDDLQEHMIDRLITLRNHLAELGIDDQQPGNSPIRSARDNLLISYSSFTWAQWVRACADDDLTIDPDCPNQCPVEAMNEFRREPVGDSIYLFEGFKANDTGVPYRDDQEARECNGIWDGHCELVRHEIDGHHYPYWVGADGPCGGTGQERRRLIEDDSVFYH